MKSYKEFKEGFAHPNHKKLDANNNGKLDADDFKLLRKKKQSTKEDCSMKEDLEEMDLSFIKGAKPRGSVADQKAARDALIAKRKETNPNPPALGGSSSDKYKLGDYDKKSNRSYSEEVEQIDELSKKTLGSYVKKAADSVQANTRQANTGDDYDLRHKSLLKTNKRISGIGSAVRKLTKEEVEELDELSKKTLGSYVKKASDSMYKMGSDSERAYGQKEIKKSFDIGNKADKRQGHINKAVDKLTKESIELDEKLDPSMGAGEYIKDFKKSDAPQFKGKSPEKRRIMGVAAFLAAKREKNK